MIRTCDGHRGHGESGCGFSASTWPGGECPMCGGAMVDAPPEVAAKWYPHERRPVSGWRLETRNGVIRLHAGPLSAMVYHRSDGPWAWSTGDKFGDATSMTAAQLAAEDALAAVRDEIAAVLR